MPFTIRPGLPKDLDTVVNLTCALAEETENGLQLMREKVNVGVSRGLREEAEGAASLRPRYWVAENEGGTVVAFVAISPEWSDWWATTYWWVLSVFVDPAARRQGIAKALFHAMQEDADRLGVQTINLRVETANASAQDFYKSCGFVVDDSHLVMSRGSKPDGTAVGS